MNVELKAALEALAREKDIKFEVICDAIAKSLVSAFDKQYKSSSNVHVDVDYDNFEFHIIAEKEVVPTEEDVMDPALEVSLEEALRSWPEAKVGDMVDIEVVSDDFGRMAAQTARNVITQAIREEEKNIVCNQFREKEKDIVVGTLKRRIQTTVTDKQTGEKEYTYSWTVDLGSADGILPEKEMVPGEEYKTGERMKFYVLRVENPEKENEKAGKGKGKGQGLRIVLSRTFPGFVKKLFESEVTEIGDGTVEIMAIAREAGSRTKMSVRSLVDNVDPVGACVGVNGARVNAIVKELKGEKIDIITYDENPGNHIRNALSPAQIVNVFADPYEKSANVVVPDKQLSLAIGKVGQNARLAAKLTNYKIDIKSETQAKDAVGFRIEDYYDDGDQIDDAQYMDEDQYEEDGQYTEADQIDDNNEDGSSSEE